MNKYDIAGRTDQGLVRQKNEDNLLLIRPDDPEQEQTYGLLLMVADGMGGMGDGDVASKTAVDVIQREYYGSTAPTIQERLAHALQTANIRLREEAERLQRKRIGTTVSGIILLPDRVMVFNVGDSRVYRLRDGQLTQLSEDQSFVAEQLKRGLITEEEARESRNVNIYMFIGVDRDLEIGFMESAHQPDDVYICCTDGLWDLVTNDEIKETVTRYPAQMAVERLIKMAHKRGAKDNVTVVVTRIGQPPTPPAERPSLSLPLILIGVAVLLAVVGAVVLLSGSDDDNDGGDASAAVIETEQTPIPTEETTVESGITIRTPTPTEESHSTIRLSTPTAQPLLAPVTFTPLPACIGMESEDAIEVESDVLYDAPNGHPIATIAEGSRLEQLDSEDNWIQVHCNNGLEGWIPESD
jgi:protein phosphatase